MSRSSETVILMGISFIDTDSKELEKFLEADIRPSKFLCSVEMKERGRKDRK